MKVLFVCASALMLTATSLPARAHYELPSQPVFLTGAPEEEGKEEHQPEENSQEEQGEEQGRRQRDQRGYDEDSSARRGPGRFVCYSRNYRGKTFRAMGTERSGAQRRALRSCREGSGRMLERSCRQAGCRRYQGGLTSP